MTETLSSQEVQRITDLYVEVFSNQELHRAGEVMTADYVNHLRFGTVSGLDAFCEFMSGVYSGMPDIAWTILDTRVDGDRIIYHYEVAGTHQGDIMGSPPTGREIRISGIEMNRIEEGVSDDDDKNSTGQIKKLSKAPADMSKKQPPSDDEEDNYSSDDDGKFGMDVGALRKRDMEREENDEEF